MNSFGIKAWLMKCLLNYHQKARTNLEWGSGGPTQPSWKILISLNYIIKLIFWICTWNAYHRVKWNTIKSLIKLKLVQTKQIMINLKTDKVKTSFPGAIEQNIINIVHKKWSAQINLVLYIIFYFRVGKKLKQKESKKP